MGRLTPLVAGLVLLSTAATARAQERATSEPVAVWLDPAPSRPTLEAIPPGEDPMRQEPLPHRGPQRDFGLNAAVHLRYSLPFGSADREIAAISGPGGTIVVIDQDLSWADLFDSGWGAEVEFDVFLGSMQEQGHKFRYGGFVALGVEHYEGDSVTDDFGRTLRPGDLDVTTYLIGGKVVQPMGKTTFLDGRFSVGAVHYSSVPATFSVPGVATFEGEFLEETWTLAFDLRGHGGVRLGPLALVAGLGLHIMLPPSEGDSVDLSGGAFFAFDLEIGAELGF